jgi:hypothetical protein
VRTNVRGDDGKQIHIDRSSFDRICCWRMFPRARLRARAPQSSAPHHESNMDGVEIFLDGIGREGA